MFKKSLIAVGVLAMTAGMAQAANVELYGRVDTGLMYSDVDVEKANGTTTETKTFALKSGANSGPRLGLRGTEDLGNGLKVSFKLENGFYVDDGSFKTGGRLFDREASLSVHGDFGTLSMGRMGGVGSSAGTYDLVWDTADVFDGGDNGICGFAMSSRYDNTLTYLTPKFAGLTGYAQYSFKGDSKQVYKDDAEKEYGTREGSAAADRYASLALKGEFGALNTIVSYEWLNYASNDGVEAKTDFHEHEDGQLIFVGGNYDLGVAKVYALAEHFKNMRFAWGINSDDVKTIKEATKDGMNGFGLHLGTKFNALAGNFKVGLYYVDGEVENVNLTGKKDLDAKYLGFATRYVYPLSKRTELYLGGGYAKGEVEGKTYLSEQKTFQAYTGLTHKF